MPKQGPSGEVPDVNVSGQGIQIGTGNNQYNAWMPKPPLDPAALGALNPHTAVARLQQLPHDELVDFFARAVAGDVSEILETFLEIDVTRVITILADINRRKASELISMVSEGDDDPLNVLPEAAQEIARKAAMLGWTDAGPVKHHIGTYIRKYADGHVHWSGESGMWTTTGVMDDYYVANSPNCVRATGNEEVAPGSSYGTEGIRQKFQYGTVYSSDHGTYRVVDNLDYEDEGGSGGWLGFPVGESKGNRGGRHQNFEGGVIYSFSKEKHRVVFAVRREVLAALPGGIEGFLPASKEAEAMSSSGVSGTVQEFDFTPGKGFRTAVYSSDFGAVAIVWQVWSYYSKLGAEKSWLGFPIDRGLTLRKPGELTPTGRQQGFENGTIYWQPGAAPIGVSTAIMRLIKQTHNLREPLGFPVSEEHQTGTGESDSIQFFEHGVVTCRDGKYEVWVRPDPKPEPPTETNPLPPTISRAVPRAIPRAVPPAPATTLNCEDRTCIRVKLTDQRGTNGTDNTDLDGACHRGERGSP